MNQPADIPIEVGGAAYRIQYTSNLNYDQPITPYAGGFTREAQKFGQNIHDVDVYLKEDMPNAPIPVERATGSKDVTPQGPPKVERINVLNPSVYGEGNPPEVGPNAEDAYNRSRY